MRGIYRRGQVSVCVRAYRLIHGKIFFYFHFQRSFNSKYTNSMDGCICWHWHIIHKCNGQFDVLAKHSGVCCDCTDNHRVCIFIRKINQKEEEEDKPNDCCIRVKSVLIWSNKIIIIQRFPKHQYGYYRRIVMRMRWDHCVGFADGHLKKMSKMNSKSCNHSATTQIRVVNVRVLKSPVYIRVQLSWICSTQCSKQIVWDPWSYSPCAVCLQTFPDFITSIRLSFNFWTHSTVRLIRTKQL